jgi:dolichyl-phosphate-mannose--protein O-mannosyl transferase
MGDLLDTPTFYIPLCVIPAFFSSFINPLLNGTPLLNQVSLDSSFLAGYLLSIELTAIPQSHLILTDSFLDCFISLTLFLTDILDRFTNKD